MSSRMRLGVTSAVSHHTNVMKGRAKRWRGEEAGKTIYLYESKGSRERTGSVPAAEALDGSHEAALELGGPPHPRHAGPGVLPHEAAPPPCPLLPRHLSLARMLDEVVDSRGCFAGWLACPCLLVLYIAGRAPRAYGQGSRAIGLPRALRSRVARSSMPSSACD